MSTFPLPGCPAWCTAKHADSSAHIRNIDSIPRAGGQLEVEVNLVQDGQDAFVEVALTDYSLRESFPEEMASFTRFPIELAGTWGHIATRLDTRGALEVGQMLVEAVQIIAEHRGCRYGWCVADHDEPGWERVHRGETVHLTGLDVTPMLSDDPSPIASEEEEREAFVRLAFASGVIHELHSRAVADYADILAGIDIGEADQVVEVLRSAAAKLGVPR